MKLKTLNSLIFLIITIAFVESCSNSNGIEITAEGAYNIEVKKTETQRGILIINDKYYLGNNVEIVKGMDKMSVNDLSIWRLNKPKPSLLQIPAPYRLIKKERNDTIIIISYQDIIIAKIK